MMKANTAMRRGMRAMAGATAALMLAGTMVGCSLFQRGSAPRGAGHLVIVGGALSPENSEIFGHMLDLAGPTGTVGVLPTASGVPEESGPLTVGDFNDHGGTGRTELIDITMNNPEQAANPDKAAQIRSKDFIFFTGGDQERIITAFRPDEGDTVSHAALWAVLAKGGGIGGTSAGAAMMSNPCIRWGNSSEALLVGSSPAADRGVGVDKGMGFFPYGLTDQHFIRRGRLGRLAVAQERTGIRWGYGVEENSAISVDLTTGRITTLGPRAVFLVDAGSVRREGLSLMNLRLSLLGGGDVIDGPTGRITPAPNKATITTNYKGDTYRTENPWGRDVAALIIDEMALRGCDVVEAEDDHFILRLTRTRDSRLYADTTTTVGDVSALLNARVAAGAAPEELTGADVAPDGVEPSAALQHLALSAVNLRMDIIAKPSADVAAAALREEIAAASAGN